MYPKPELSGPAMRAIEGLEKIKDLLKRDPITIHSADVDDEIWTTRDGRKLRVGEMHPEHLRNVLRMLLRRARQRRAASLNRELDMDFE
jgi:hypothetical protein